jgi:DNA-binding response OmpR family regulator
MVFGENAFSRSERYQDPHLEVDYTTASVSLDSRPVSLAAKEYELLSLLVQNAGQVVRRDALLWRIWGYNGQVRTRTLDVHIRRLRKKLGNYSDQSIETIFGIGYRFQPFRERPPLSDPCGVPAIVSSAELTGNVGVPFRRV